MKFVKTQWPVVSDRQEQEKETRARDFSNLLPSGLMVEAAREKRPLQILC